jgi:O-antigen/teichoic acid export membrane protein
MFSFINTLFSFILIAVNQQKKLLVINIGAIFINLVINMLIIPKYGFRGAAATSVVAECYILMATFLASRRYLAYRIHFTNLFKIIGASLVMAGVVYAARDPSFALMQNKNILLLIPLGGLLYAIFLWLTGVITSEKLGTLLKKEQPEVINIEKN